MEVIINRLVEGQKQTLGELQIKEKGKVVFRANTLELPNKHNQKNISSIPVGIYPARKGYSSKNKSVVKIGEVPGRNYIQIHSGNYNSQIEGCILVGEYFEDINKDNYLDVVNSRVTLASILNLLPDDKEFNVTIKKKLV